MDHPNNQSTNAFPAQLRFGFGHQGLTPEGSKIANLDLNIEPVDFDPPVPWPSRDSMGGSEEGKEPETAS